jgi:hypothetical protein
MRSMFVGDDFAGRLFLRECLKPVGLTGWDKP